MPETCCYCGADTYPHCRNGHPTCDWVKCQECGTIHDATRHVARRGAESVDWPS